jgi:hypothetical protein
MRLMCKEIITRVLFRDWVRRACGDFVSLYSMFGTIEYRQYHIVYNW